MPAVAELPKVKVVPKVKTPEEVISGVYPPKYGEVCKINPLFVDSTYKYYRVDFWNTLNGNKIERSFFLKVDKNNLIKTS